MKSILPTFVLVVLVSTPGALSQDPAVARPHLDLTEIRRLPVLEGERYKPLDSLAREWVQRITGKEVFRNTDPVLLLLHWRFEPGRARAGKYIRLPHAQAARAIGHEPTSSAEAHVSWDELAVNQRFHQAVEAARQKEDRARNQMEDDLLALSTRWSVLGSIAGLHQGWEAIEDDDLGGWLPVVPPPQLPRPGIRYQWLSPAEMGRAWPEGRVALVQEQLQSLRSAFVTDDGAAFLKASVGLREALAGLGYPRGMQDDLAFPGMATMDREIRYNRAQPFRWTTWIYLGAFWVSLLAAVWRRSRTLRLAALIPALGGLAFHAWGLWERTTLSRRAMIGTFYESMLYVAGAAVLIGLIFEFIFKNRWFVLSGSLLGFTGLFVAIMNPDFMQPAISNLRPVLINNDWIHIHVPTIMTGYSVLGLAFVLGQIYLLRYLFQGDQHPNQRQLARTMFWVIPVGVTILFAGIVLGGVWADASWGRFWGWDPKEVGALILWLCFMLVIHGRWAGWLRDFGTATGTMVGGWALMWSYYGTNFFWSGLHSYAAASADTRIPLWLFVFTGVQLALLGATVVRWRRDRRLATLGPASPPGTAEDLSSASTGDSGSLQAQPR